MFDKLVFVWAVGATLMALWLSLPGEIALVSSEIYAYASAAGLTGAEKPTNKHSAKKVNVVFMVSDGMGPASLSMTRSFRQFTHDLDPLTTLHLDNYFIGHSRTRSSNSLVTDSAAGATAFACGLKTYNGAIAVDPEGLPCATVLEAAKLKGFTTGMVVTTRITDATPASFAAHAHDRSEEDFIAEQLIGSESHPFGRMCDLLVGGGRCHFLPASAEGGCRADHRNLVKEAEASGWTYVDKLTETGPFNASHLPLLGLLAPGDIPFDIDRRDHRHPSLHDSAVFALKTLSEATEATEHGFFLMIEGSRIDHAGHSNDPLAQVHEVLAYDETFNAVVEFASKSDVPTIVISTSDHETGGLAVARQVTTTYPEYLWHPAVLANASHSTEYLARKLRHHKAKSEAHLEEYIADYVLGPRGLNLQDVSKDEIEYIAHHRSDSHDVLAQLISRRAQIGWSTHGHSAVDVNVYGFSNNGDTLHSLRGGNENIELGMFMQKHIGVDLEPLTRKLREGFGDKF